MFCPHCGKQVEVSAHFCSSCGQSTAQPIAGRSRIVRPRSPRLIAGVCSGFALFYGWDVALVRVLTLVTFVLTGGTVAIAYVAAWILIPESQYALSSGAGRGTTA